MITHRPHNTHHTPPPTHTRPKNGPAVPGGGTLQNQRSHFRDRSKTERSEMCHHIFVARNKQAVLGTNTQRQCTKNKHQARQPPAIQTVAVPTQGNNTYSSHDSRHKNSVYTTRFRPYGHTGNQETGHRKKTPMVQ